MIRPDAIFAPREPVVVIRNCHSAVLEEPLNRMPSPLGHALSGLAVAWSVEALTFDRTDVPRSQSSIAQWKEIALVAALIAILPDVDLFLGQHRGWTHSVGGALLAGAFGALYARRRALPLAPTATALALACAAHAVLDWLGTDGSMPRGVMALWPFDHRYHVSPIAILPRVERRYWLGWEFVRAGIVAVVLEGIVFGGLAYAAWKWRAARLPRLLQAGHSTRRGQYV
jgi:membrane-bound metal-dependent hydrolase YbcI (DUF457 family)